MVTLSLIKEARIYNVEQTEMKETIPKISKTKIWFLEKVNKIDKPLARLMKKKGRRLKSPELEMRKEK